MTIISPSILSADFANLERDIKLVEKAGADWLHIDVMDGHFVPNITIGVPVVKSIRKITKLPLDVHLMIENPEKYIEPFAASGADIITFHYEAVAENNIPLVINQIKSFNLKAGMSIKPKTPANVVFPYLNDLDMVLVMTVEPGFGGQHFMAEQMDKVRTLRKLIDKRGRDIRLEVDGGVDGRTAPVCIEAGADVLVAGSAIFHAQDRAAAIQLIKGIS